MGKFLEILVTIIVTIFEVIGNILNVVADMLGITSRDIIRFVFAVICGIILFSILYNMMMAELQPLFQLFK